MSGERRKFRVPGRRQPGPAGGAGWHRLTFLWVSAAGSVSWLTTVRLVRPVTGGA